jgi:hypothetical protein
MTSWLRAASAVCTAMTAVAAIDGSIRPLAASQASPAQVATRKTPPIVELTSMIRSILGAAARVRLSIRSEIERYQNTRYEVMPLARISSVNLTLVAQPRKF